ncbi:hypothetical protein KP803_12150 [Vibrio sp. ZSDE26]|uniref:Uncharacterized protein n=1 Tax=Vibrio amylolyticus TaxID=2847292 RepID=A0A9X2BLJ9_9VIBR|nr:hypothetical protein [Vibrio amylolyticus]MCK6264023.1 hypothetical protein [Vibrio amylolyticus]
MKKRRLPIPLILLIPIVLLGLVVIAGIYRFSLSDEDILQKFPQHAVVSNAIVSQVFGVNSSNPLTIQVPETNAFAFVNYLNEKNQKAIGQYDDGKTRGNILIDVELLRSFPLAKEPLFIAPFVVSNQGTGVFHYLALFRYDAMRDRMILADYAFLGDRIKVEALTIVAQLEDDLAEGVTTKEQLIAIELLTREPDQAMATAAKLETQNFYQVSDNYNLKLVLPSETEAPL